MVLNLSKLCYLKNKIWSKVEGKLTALDPTYGRLYANMVYHRVHFISNLRDFQRQCWLHVIFHILSWLQNQAHTKNSTINYKKEILASARHKKDSYLQDMLGYKNSNFKRINVCIKYWVYLKYFKKWWSSQDNFNVPGAWVGQ